MKTLSSDIRLFPLEYQTWRHIIERCSDVNRQHYGARGISVCERWKSSFTAFLEDMGGKPSPSHSIDRIDNDGDYEPTNCRWATCIEQQNNRREIKPGGRIRGGNRLVHCGGLVMTVAQWSRKVGLSESVIHNRLRLGWGDEEAVCAPNLGIGVRVRYGGTERI